MLLLLYAMAVRRINFTMSSERGLPLRREPKRRLQNPGTERRRPRITFSSFFA